MTLKVSGPVARLTNRIARAESTSIEDRWRWGLTVLRDPHLMAESRKSLKHGAAEYLVAHAGRTPAGKPLLSEQEIQRRIRCARAYPYASQIRHAMTDFGTWYDLVQAKFPDYPSEPGEEPADPRTRDEVRRDRERQYAQLLGEQATLFPLDELLPETTTVRRLDEWVREQEEIGRSFQRTTGRRRAHVEELKKATCGELAMLWADAARLLDAPDHECDGAAETRVSGPPWPPTRTT